MKKELVFQAKLETEEFDRTVSNLQSKLKDIYAPANMVRAQSMTGARASSMGFPGMSQPSMEAFNKATQQSRRELDSLIKEQVKGQQELGKEVTRRNEELQKLKTQYKDIINLGKEDLALREKISRVEQNLTQQRNTYMKQDSQLNGSLDVKRNSPFMSNESINNFLGNGRGNQGPPNSGSNFGTGSGMSASNILTTIATLLTGAAKVYQQIYESPLKTTIATGGAVQGTIGRELEGIYSGRSAYEAAFLPEKLRSFQKASDVMQGNRTIDKMLLGAGTAGLASAGLGHGGGVLKTALSLGVLGSSDRMRALSGSTVAGALGDTLGTLPVMGGSAKRYFGNISNQQNQQYEAIHGQQLADNFMKALEGEKAQNPLKRIAAEYYQDNYTRNLNSQRSLGLNYDSFTGHGSYRDSVINEGFTDSMGMDMSSGILGAGGSTRAARNAGFGLKLQRNADITNSASILGRLSGSLGSSEATNQATIKILAEGTKIGLDSSQYAEENRKFSQAAADAIAKSGATNPADIDRILSRFGSAMTEKTGAGIEAGTTANQMYQGITGATSGPGGVMRAGGFLREFGKMNPMTRAALSQLPEDMLTTDHPYVQSAANEMGTSPESIINTIRNNINSPSNTILPGTDKLKQGLQSRMKTMGVSDLSNFQGPLDPSMQSDLSSFQTGIGLENKLTDRRQIQSLSNQILSGGGSSNTTLEAAKNAQINGGYNSTNRVEDVSVKEAAQGSKVILDNFRDFRNEIVPAAKEVERFTQTISKLVSEIMKLPEDKRIGPAQAMYQQLGGKVQPQAGKVGH